MELRWGWIDPKEITPIRINFNPAFSMPGIPAPFGGQPIGPHRDPEVRASFARDGIVNPVFLWARFNQTWVRYGGSRVHFSQKHEIPKIQALIVDYENMWPDLMLVDEEQAMARFQDPPIGLTPNAFVIREDGSLDVDVTLWSKAVGT